MMRTDDADPAAVQKLQAGRLLRELLEAHGRGSKAALGRRLVEEGNRAGEQLPRRWMSGDGFGRAQQRTVVRLLRELAIADVDDDYFERGGPPASPAAGKYASLTAVLSRRPLRSETVKLLLAQADLLEIDDPGEQHWTNMASIFEGLYAASDAVRGPTKPRGGPARRR